MIIHIVIPGDTITSISHIYSVSEDSIIGDNSLTHPNKLVLGQALIIQTSDLPNNKMISLQVNGYVYAKHDKSKLKIALPFLTYLTIFGYSITPSGDISTIDDEELILISKESGVAPIMFLSTINSSGTFSSKNAGLLLRNLESQDKLVETILLNMIHKGYRGIHVDFGFIPSCYTKEYADFLHKLKSALNPLGYEVIVGIPPRTIIHNTNIIFNSQNTSDISSLANTFTFLEYEWGHTYGPPKAISPISKLEKVVSKALTQTTPSKACLGIHNMGNDWALPYRMYFAAKSLSNQGATDIARRYESTIEYDSVAQAPYFHYIASKDRNHMVWFEDARSIQAKFDLVKESNLSGIGIWNIEKVIPQFWSLLRSNFKIEKV